MKAKIGTTEYWITGTQLGLQLLDGIARPWGTGPVPVHPFSHAGRRRASMNRTRDEVRLEEKQAEALRSVRVSSSQEDISNIHFFPSTFLTADFADLAMAPPCQSTSFSANGLNCVVPL